MKVFQATLQGMLTLQGLVSLPCRLFGALSHIFKIPEAQRKSRVGCGYGYFQVPHSHISTLTQVSASSILGAKKSLLFNVFFFYFPKLWQRGERQLKA